uniref:Uncharacterized protein n=1 Tax=Ditylenchus dipsaci TaxID=166011 RepID=A0A915D419_9BILA
MGAIRAVQIFFPECDIWGRLFHLVQNMKKTLAEHQLKRLYEKNADFALECLIDGCACAFMAGAALKVVIVLLTIVVLVLLDPSYVTAYISVNYEIVLIYIIAALTLLYCIVSMVMYAVMQKSVAENEEVRLTNCALSEIVFSGAGMICWMIVCGIGGTVAQRTIIETGEFFGWLAACAGVIVCLFVGVFGSLCTEYCE